MKQLEGSVPRAELERALGAMSTLERRLAATTEEAEDSMKRLEGSVPRAELERALGEVSRLQQQAASSDSELDELRASKLAADRAASAESAQRRGRLATESAEVARLSGRLADMVPRTELCAC